MNDLLKSLPKDSRLVVAEHASCLSIDVMPLLARKPAGVCATVIGIVALMWISIVWTLFNWERPAAVIVSVIVAGVAAAVIVGVLAAIDRPRLWLQSGKLTVEWRDDFVEAIRIGRHSATTISHDTDNSNGGGTLSGFVVHGEDGRIRFREPLSDADITWLVTAIDRVCFTDAQADSPQARRSTPAVGPGAKWSEKVQIICDDAKRFEMMILPSAEGSGPVASIGGVLLLMPALGLVFRDQRVFGPLGIFGMLVLCATIVWIRMRVRIAVDSVSGTAVVTRYFLGLPVSRRLQLGPAVTAGLQVDSVHDDVPKYRIVIGSVDKLLRFGKSLGNDELRRLVYRIREVIGIPDGEDLYFNVGIQERGESLGKRKDLAASRLPLDSAIRIAEFEDDRVQLRLPAIEFKLGKALFAGCLLLGVAWCVSLILTGTGGGVIRFGISILMILVGTYGAFGHVALSIRDEEARFTRYIGPIPFWTRSAMTVSALAEAIQKTDETGEKLNSLRSVRRGSFENPTHLLEQAPYVTGRFPEHFERLATRVAQTRRTRGELVALLTFISREWPNAFSLQPPCQA